MRLFLLLGIGLAVAGCTEVTRFKDSGSGDIFMAECDSGLRLQSCRAALDFTCPSGYDLLGPVQRREGDSSVPTEAAYFRCR